MPVSRASFHTNSRGCARKASSDTSVYISGIDPRHVWLVASACSLLIVALVVAMGARADESGPDPRVLGVTEGLLTYCEKMDPPAAAQYRERLKVLTQGASEAALARLRDSDVYRKARESLDDFVGKVDEHNAKRVCTNGLLNNRGRK